MRGSEGANAALKAKLNHFQIVVVIWSVLNGVLRAILLVGAGLQRRGHLLRKAQGPVGGLGRRATITLNWLYYFELKRNKQQQNAIENK